jgi:hypothetical protein
MKVYEFTLVDKFSRRKTVTQCVKDLKQVISHFELQGYIVMSIHQVEHLKIDYNF